MMTEHLTTTAAAKLLRVDPLTVGKWVDKGFLKAYRTAGGHRRIPSDDLRRYFVEHGMPLPEELGKATTLKLLVVDDEQPVVNTIKRSFRSFKDQVEVITTTSGVMALILLSDTKPDAMLIDVHMAGLDGFEVCRQVHAYAPLSGVKLYLMTSVLKPALVNKAIEVGALGCFEKPIDASAVVTLMQSGSRKRAVARF